MKICQWKYAVLLKFVDDIFILKYDDSWWQSIWIYKCWKVVLSSTLVSAVNPWRWVKGSCCIESVSVNKLRLHQLVVVGIGWLNFFFFVFFLAVGLVIFSLKSSSRSQPLLLSPSAVFLLQHQLILQVVAMPQDSHQVRPGYVITLTWVVHYYTVIEVMSGVRTHLHSA